MASGSEHSCRGLVSGFVGTIAHVVQGPAFRRQTNKQNLTFVNFAKAYDPGNIQPGLLPGLGVGGAVNMRVPGHKLP